MIIDPTATWVGALREVRKHVVRIATPFGSGTGFLLHPALDPALAAVATADHVVCRAQEWHEPIRITHDPSKTNMFLRYENRRCHPNSKDDLALLIFGRGDFDFPAEELPRIPDKERLNEGVQIGWCGYPSVFPSQLCFFRGCISAYNEKEKSYMVDGVVIHGVSGGPAFYLNDDGKPELLGLVSAYVPNRATGESLPGLGEIRPINPFGSLYELLEDAAKKESEESPPTPGVTAAEPDDCEGESSESGDT